MSSCLTFVATVAFAFLMPERHLGCSMWDEAIPSRSSVVAALVPLDVFFPQESIALCSDDSGDVEGRLAGEQIG